MRDDKRKAMRILFGILALLLICAALLPASVQTVFLSPVHLPIAIRTANVKGLVMNAGQFHCEDLAAVGATWYVTGGQTLPLCADQESVPILNWDHEQDAIGGNSRYIVGWNEPDPSGITPAAAAVRWHDVVEPRAAILRKSLVGPGISHEGVWWLEAWLSEYQTRYGRMPILNAVSVHCYGNLAFCQPIVGAVVDIAAAHSWNVWVTEYNRLYWGNVSRDQALIEAMAFLGWTRTQFRIQRVAWFNSRTYGGESWSFKPPEMNAPVVSVDGMLTAASEMYRGW